MKTRLGKGFLWVRQHPKITGVIGTGAVLAAGVYGGPPAAAVAQVVLPFICDVLRLCA